MGPGDVVAGRFVIDRAAGSGGMSVIYRALDRSTNELVALKVVRDGRPAHRGRFEREAKLLSELRHPNIVRHVAHGSTASGLFWLAMEWLEGETLSQRLQRAPLDVNESVEVLRQVASALAVAHQHGVVHRDVKPSNLLLADGDLRRLRLLDFGVARLGGQAQDTAAGALVGTPGFMSPEQACGMKEIDARTDVFALGCVAYRCLAKRPPFAGKDVMAVLLKIVLEEVPHVATIAHEVPFALDDLVARMMAKNPAHRPADGAIVLGELEEIGDATSVDRKTYEPKLGDALTTAEQDVLSVVLAATHLRDDADVTALASAISPLGTRLERLLDGTLMVVVSGRGSATDQVANAARSALLMREALPNAPMVIATGRAMRSSGIAVGEVIDRAAMALETAGKGPIVLDDATTALLDVRFEVSLESGRALLSGERANVERTRTLLGRATPCVGREREIAQLVSAFEDCVSEPRARAMVVIAQAGIGKSRLRYEFLRALERRQQTMEIWVERGDPMRAGSPFSMIAPSLRRSAGVHDGEPIEDQRSKVRARVERHVPEAERARVVAFLGELVGVPFPDESIAQLTAARRDPMLMGDQMRRAFEDFLAAECSAHPMLLVLEDLHWGDLPSVKLLDSALRNLASLPLFVLALARPEVVQLFPKLWSERDVQVIRLPVLSKKSGERLVRDVLGEDVEPEIVARVVDRAAGNAFYLEELIRAVAEGKGDALPETVLAMVHARLETLDPELRRILRAASVFGQAFWRDGVRALLGAEEVEDEVRLRLARLVEREVITRRTEGKFPGQDEYSFRHALLREGAYALLTDRDRVVGHRLAAEWLERSGERDAMLLADHFERGGEPGRAIEWYLRAAEEALQGNDFDAAIERAERGIVCGAVGEVLGSLRMVQAEAHRWRGDANEAGRCIDEALERLPKGSARWCSAAGEAATAHGRSGNRARFAVVARELCALKTEAPSRSAHAVALTRAGIGALYAGEFEIARLALIRMEELFAALGDADDAVAAKIIQTRAIKSMHDGDVAGTLRLAEAARQRFEAAGDLRNACIQLGNVGDALKELGIYDRAEAALRDALATAERMQLSGIIAFALQNLGIVVAHLGNLAEAEAIERRSIALFDAQRDARMAGSGRAYLADILAQAGDLEGAEGAAIGAVSEVSELPPTQSHALAKLARIQLMRGRPADALRNAEEAMRILDTLGHIDEGEALVRLVFAETLRANRHFERAEEAIAIAHARLLERADRIADESFRTSFLESVPENARTCALADEWRR